MLTTCVAAVLLATSLFAGAGCGKSSNSTATTANALPRTSQTAATDVASGGPTSNKTLTRDALVAEGNAICKRIAAQSATVNTRTKSQQALTRQMVQLVGYDYGALTALSHLRPSGSMESQWKPVATLATSLAGEMTKFGSALTENRVKYGFSQLFPMVRAVEQKLIAAAVRVGLKDCAAI